MELAKLINLVIGLFFILSLKRLKGSIWPLLMVFLLLCFLQRRWSSASLWLNIINSHIFVKISLKFLMSFRRYEDFPLSLLTIFIISFYFLLQKLSITKKITTSAYNRWCKGLPFCLQPNSNRLFNNCIKFYWNWISTSWNMKGEVKLTPPLEKSYL